MRKILHRLRETNIQADVDKCEFYITETRLLEIIVEKDEIKMNFEKIKTIIE